MARYQVNGTNTDKGEARQSWAWMNLCQRAILSQCLSTKVGHARGGHLNAHETHPIQSRIKDAMRAEVERAPNTGTARER